MLKDGLMHNTWNSESFTQINSVKNYFNLSDQHMLTAHVLRLRCCLLITAFGVRSLHTQPLRILF